MNKAIEFRTEINKILREKGYNRKDIGQFWKRVKKMAVNRNDKKIQKQVPKTVNKLETLTRQEPKYLVNYLSKKIKGRGYTLQKSPTTGSNTYYFRSEILGQRVIRVSNHNLHEKQIKTSQIDLVIQENLKVTLNNKTIIPDYTNQYRFVVAMKILEILPSIK